VSRARGTGLLRVDGFGALWSSNLLQFFALQVHLFTLQWLVTELTASRALLGLAKKFQSH
jgi:hypothetical protein